MSRRVLLIILDGWGIAPAGPGNAISLARTSNFDLFWSKYPHTLLTASGEEVGLPESQIGNSEVGHLNIGAGRVVYQDLPRINRSIKDGTFFENETLKKTFEYAKKRKGPLHLIGLVSPGGVHSHQEHLYALLSMAKHFRLHEVYIHVITDGRDVGPKTASLYIEKLEEKIKELGVGKIATVMGRYYAMDRDARWSRIQLAYQAMVLGKGELSKTAAEAIKRSYLRDVTDEFIKPTVIEKKGVIKDEDPVIFFNLRSDRPRELTRALIDSDFKEFKRDKKLKDLYFVTMTEYEKDLTVKGVVFEPVKIKNCLGEVVSENNLKQCHIAETEKYAHVTFFFNGGQEEILPGEKRIMVPSPKVSTYDLKPEMSASEIAKQVTEKMGQYDFILVNFANLDMVGHTGNIPATIKAIETVDACVGGIVMAAKSLDYSIIITADHGNAEKMLHNDGTPFTAHTTNPVPLIILSPEVKHLKYLLNPTLANIAPTVLELMGIEKPAEMTASALIEKINRRLNV